MALHVGMVTDPRAPAEFWTAASDMRVVPDHGVLNGEYVLLKGDRDLPLGLQRVSEPTAGTNRVHLDLSTKDMVGRLGASVVEGHNVPGAFVVEGHEVPGLAWTVLSDPDGNVFCAGAEG